MKEKSASPGSEEDPGMIFILGTPANVHNALGLASVANVNPPLRRGEFFNTVVS